MSNYLGLDIGGSHISIGLVEDINGQTKPEHLASKPIDRNSSLDGILDFISECIQNWKEDQILGRTVGTGFGSVFYKDNCIVLNGGLDQKEYLYDTPYKEGIAGLLINALVCQPI